MGNLGMPELMMILVLALLLFGPKKLPEIGKQVGKALGEFKRASNDLKRTIEDEMEKASSGLKIDDSPPPDAAKAEAATPEVPKAAAPVNADAAPAIAPADGTVARPSETTKTPAP